MADMVSFCSSAQGLWTPCRQGAAFCCFYLKLYQKIAYSQLYWLKVRKLASQRLVLRVVDRSSDSTCEYYTKITCLEPLLVSHFKFCGCDYTW